MSHASPRYRTVTFPLPYLIVISSLILLTAVSAAAQGVEVRPAIYHDVSPPLDGMQPASPKEGQHEQPLRLIPHPQSANQAPDAALQTFTGPNIATTSGLSFDGVGVGMGGYSPCCAPPDTEGSVGASQYVQWVNLDFAIFDKATGALQQGPTPGNTIWSGVTAGNCKSNNDGDPIVLYDKAAGRWLFSQFSVTGGPPYYQCVAVSTTSDARGTYNRYVFGPYSNFNDYPKIGVWPDAYYVSYNMFRGGVTFAGAQACAWDRSKMLTGAAATEQCYTTSSSYGGLLPSDLDGASPPPTGSPNTFLAFGTNVLQYWKFHVDWATPANSTFGSSSNPNGSIAVAAFSEACGGGACIPQSGTRQQLDSLGDRLMYRLAYRHFSDHESLVVNHSVSAGSSVGVRWYELRTSGGNPTLYQQGTYAPDSNYRWMGSIAMDKAGNMAVGYSISSSSMNPSVRYTGRVPSDPLGSLEAETILFNGSGSQLPNLARWGDYSTMSIDPVDDCTFWYTTEYLKSSGTFNWSTHIASFVFPGCTGTASPDFSISATPASQTVTQAGSTSYTVNVTPSGGFAGTVTFGLTGLPSGATGTFNPTSVAGSGSSTLSVTTSSTTPAGTYTLTITGTSGTLSHSTTVTLVVNSAGGAGDFAIAASPASVTVTRKSSANYTVTVTGTNGFSGTVSFSVSGLPSHSNASFNPATVTGSGTSTMTATTNPVTTTGTFTLTITGTSGSLSHAAQVSMVVN